MKNQCGWAVTGFLMVCCIAMSAGAEEQKYMTLGTMTVTAQKQEENVQDVPMCITVFSDQDIDDKKIKSISEIADFVPNFMVFNEGGPGINSPSMRGIHAPHLSYTTSVGLFIDGIPILSTFGYEDALLYVERVEVLRGPQGTLYGKNTQAGVVNIITAQPNNQLTGKISAELGRLLSGETGDKLKKEISFNVSGPIQKDSLFIGLAGQFYQRDGYIENTITGDTVDDREHWLGKAHLRWTPTDQLDISLIASMLEHDDGGANITLGEYGAATYGISVPGDRKVTSNLEGNYKPRENSQALKINYDFSELWTLTSITTRRSYNDEAVDDFDYTGETLSHIYKDDQLRTTAQEFRLNYASEQLTWLLGLYYDNDYKHKKRETISSYSSMNSSTDREIDGDTYAAFVHVTYGLAPHINLIAGLRYEQQDQEFEDNLNDKQLDDSWDAFTPKIGVEYHFTSDVLTYATVSKGYRSGGFNALADEASPYYSYDEEELWSYEIGMKNTLLNKRLILNGALFYMNISDMQVTDAVTPATSYLTNAAKATAKGIEVEATVRVTQGLSLMGSFGYTDLEFEDFEDAKGDYEGNRNPYTPDYTYNIGAQYRYPGGLYLRADLIGYGKMYFDRANEYSRDSYQLVNAKIGYETERFDVYLYGKNIFDEEYNSYGYYSGFYTIYSDPGEVGLQMTWRF
ncbi:TonB-dependent receptor [Desulfosarcina ovata subsp. sediminis]|uniref:TonB-dependent receptor n=1 Tax=Desulfosarcina ovata subsp. sediminis TaxID=885957 RepID=A0A5K7ZZ85_9BACT|nr:TonB-dependent receptor [Desulfosarcina ovata]BBO85451.1 TonB-dependent receptor [Desulfosarcina ovata subsp. sediminis]